jgi:hypothetical protein
MADAELVATCRELLEVLGALMRACELFTFTNDAVIAWEQELLERGLTEVGIRAEAVIARAEAR